MLFGLGFNPSHAAADLTSVLACTHRAARKRGMDAEDKPEFVLNKCVPLRQHINNSRRHARTQKTPGDLECFGCELGMCVKLICAHDAQAFLRDAEVVHEAIEVPGARNSVKVIIARNVWIKLL